MVEGQIAIENYRTGNTEHHWDLKKIQSAHKVLTTYSYKKGEVNKGYANRTLYVNLDTGVIQEKPVTDEIIAVAIKNPGQLRRSHTSKLPSLR